VGVGVVSLTDTNIKNGPGHYRHDPLKSPYASPYYATLAKNSTQQAAIQSAFEQQLADVSALYGQWNAPNWTAEMTNPDFKNADYRDVTGRTFAATAWQSNATYVPQFLQQAKRLVSRVKEGIYQEYGYGILQEHSTALKDTITARRLTEFKVIVWDHFVIDKNGAAMDVETGSRPVPGIAYLNTAAWEGLIRKLLHAMVTTDEFYVVAVGNANTYAANNFQQSAVMEFNTIMEPVFDRLGVRLISRNMGMNISTSVSALGGADIYGEADIFWHSPDTVVRPGVVPEPYHVTDLLHKQAMLSGERMPVILSPVHPVELLNATNNTAWFGNIQPGASFCEATILQNGKTMVPLVKACRFVNCGPGADCDKHNSVCWVERSDQNPLPQQTQDANVGHQKEGYPSVQAQRLEGRKLAMLVLHALDEALDRWSEQVKKGVFPLPDEMWHVGPVYEELREKVRTMQPSGCDHLFRKLDPSICHMEMHVRILRVLCDVSCSYCFCQYNPKLYLCNGRSNSSRSSLLYTENMI
jgi:hypothetical protein